MGEYETLCHREKQIIQNASLKYKRNANHIKNDNTICNSRISDKSDVNYGKNCRNAANDTIIAKTPTNVCNGQQIKSKSLDVSLEDVLNCNDIQIETTNDAKGEDRVRTEVDKESDLPSTGTQTIPRMMAKSNLKLSKSVPVSQSNSSECVSDQSTGQSLARRMSDDRDFVTKL